jgi:outer membrane protein assembly factor BamD
MKMRRSFLLITVGCLLFFLGCAHEEPKIRPAQEIYDEASQFANKGKVEQATEKFMEVRTYYPGDDLAKKSLLATADLYYNNELYESALQSYEEYRMLYPTDTEASFCLYRIGLSNFKEMTTYDRDQNKTVKTIQSFENFLSSYPNSQFSQAAKDHLSEAKIILAKHYLYIGKFYLKKKEYKSACTRFQYVKDHYSDLVLEEDVDSLIARSCAKVEKTPKP